jgi:hypothetical protein
MVTNTAPVPDVILCFLWRDSSWPRGILQFLSRAACYKSNVHSEFACSHKLADYDIINNPNH